MQYLIELSIKLGHFSKVCHRHQIKILYNYCATFWKNINICEGNNDVQDVIKQRLDFKVPFPSQAGNESLAYLENETMVKLDIYTDSFNIVYTCPGF